MYFLLLLLPSSFSCGQQTLYCMVPIVLSDLATCSHACSREVIILQLPNPPCMQPQLHDLVVALPGLPLQLLSDSL